MPVVMNTDKMIIRLSLFTLNFYLLDEELALREADSTVVTTMGFGTDRPGANP